MKFLPEKTQNQSGQILVIFLLVLVVGLAVTLSIASRTVTDIRQTTTSDESNRSYFAAESGIEKALRQIQDSPGFVCPVATPNCLTVDLAGINRSTGTVGIQNLGVPDTNTVFEFPDLLNQDDVAQVNLMSNFSDIATAGNSALLPYPSFIYSDHLDLYWDNTSAANNGGDNQPALEVSILTCSNPCTGTPTFDIKKMVFDPRKGTRPFSCNLPDTSGVFISAGNNVTSQNGLVKPDFKYKAVLNFNSSCGNNDTLRSSAPVDNPVLARIRPLYNNSPIKLAVGSSKLLPPQGSQITSLGTTPSGVSRKLVVNRLFPALPALFDYVLFNGSPTQPLQKP